MCDILQDGSKAGKKGAGGLPEPYAYLAEAEAVMEALEEKRAELDDTWRVSCKLQRC